MSSFWEARDDADAFAFGVGGDFGLVFCFLLAGSLSAIALARLRWRFLEYTDPRRDKKLLTSMVLVFGCSTTITSCYCSLLRLLLLLVLRLLLLTLLLPLLLLLLLLPLVLLSLLLLLLILLLPLLLRTSMFFVAVVAFLLSLFLLLLLGRMELIDLN